MISPIDVEKKGDKIQQTLMIINAQHYNNLERKVGWGGRWEGGSRGREHMHTYG